jgi:hypothetical protein
MTWANRRQVVVSEFYGDPNARFARSLMCDLIARVQGMRTHPYGISNGDPGATMNGYAVSPQTFVGLNTGVGATTAFRNGDAADIASGLVDGPGGDPARRIFAQRLQRRGWSG